VPPIPPAPPGGAFPHTIPSGAIWLIAIGLFFLIGHAPVFRVFHGRLFVPMFMIGLGVWMFVRRMTETGHGIENDGSEFYRWRLAHAVNGAAWVVLIGVLWLLHVLGVLVWEHSWPIFMIAAGLLMIFRRMLFSGYGPTHTYGPVQPPGAAPATTATGIVPVDPLESHMRHGDSDASSDSGNQDSGNQDSGDQHSGSQDSGNQEGR
jgi:hypothetical protein